MYSPTQIRTPGKETPRTDRDFLKILELNEEADTPNIFRSLSPNSSRQRKLGVDNSPIQAPFQSPFTYDYQGSDLISRTLYSPFETLFTESPLDPMNLSLQDVSSDPCISLFNSPEKKVNIIKRDILNPIINDSIDHYSVGIKSHSRHHNQENIPPKKQNLNINQTDDVVATWQEEILSEEIVKKRPSSEKRLKKRRKLSPQEIEIDNIHPTHEVAYITPENVDYIQNFVVRNEEKQQRKVEMMDDDMDDDDMDLDTKKKKKKSLAWSTEEDEYLKDLVEKFGKKRWSKIASFMSLRNGKQCRARWFNHLDPGINKGPWTKEEDDIINRYHNEIGNKWTEMSQFLPGRTPNAIKNHWNSTMRRQREGGNSTD